VRAARSAPGSWTMDGSFGRDGRRETPCVRFVVYGAGAVGGVVAARLHQYGEEVVLIARGPHYERLRSDGLTIRDPEGERTLPIRAERDPAGIDWREGDVALVAVKSQHTAGVLAALAAAAPGDLPVVCLQNGVRNEEEALRRFQDVYGVPVACPCVHLEPGVVEAHSSPVTGILDVGRYPAGADGTAETIVEAFRAASFDARPIGDLARWKWRKLVTNLGNAIEAVCGPAARPGPIGALAAKEGEACLAAAGIEAATEDEDRRRRGDLLQRRPVAGRERPGGSTWQSLARRTFDAETDYLNGEVVLLGRTHGVPTPVNELLQRLVRDLARGGGAPAALSEERVLAMLDA
jgi:2-dehydropantoate 2-reductase